jgi:anti-sigma factor ChrR (cupin superfamily)
MKAKYIKTTDIEWGKIQKDVFEKQCIVNKNGLNISILKIEPNKIIPMHKHLDTRYNYILQGRMSDESNEYSKGDIVINEKDSKHFLEAGSEGCEFLLIWD